MFAFCLKIVCVILKMPTTIKDCRHFLAHKQVISLLANFIIFALNQWRKLFAVFHLIIDLYTKYGAPQPINPGIAARAHSAILGGCAVTANVDSAMNAVPIIPGKIDTAVAAEVFDFSSAPISSIHASKCCCRRISSVLFAILRSLLPRCR